MTVRELNRDQLIELKEQYLIEKYGGDTSYYDLSLADSTVPDGTIYAHYAGYEFSPDDFACSSGTSSEYSLELVDCFGDRDTIVAELRQIANDIENGYYHGMASYGTSWSIM